MSETTPSPEGVARTPTGEIATQTQTTAPAATTEQTSTTTEKPSLANAPVEQPTAPVPPTRAPETYTDFSVPTGYKLDPAVDSDVKSLFKTMDLPQADAQRLMDMYIKHSTKIASAPYDLWEETQTKWVQQVKEDREMGSRIGEIQSTIAKAIDGLGDPKLAQGFRQAMDFTGAGNNPDFIRAFWKLSQKLVEGSHVSGNGPSPAANGAGNRRPTAAQAMYPNLPTSS